MKADPVNSDRFDVPRTATDDSSLTDRSAAREWLEAGWAALNDGDRILDISESLAVWLGVPAAAAVGQSCWSLLEERCPTWGADLARLRAAKDTFVAEELILAATEGSSPGWYRIERTRLPGGSAVRLSSVLPPRAELAEGGWGAHLSGASGGREMFVRLLGAEAQLERLSQHWPGVIFSQRPDFSFQYVSGRMAELTGCPLEHWRQRRARFWDFIHEADAGELQKQVAQASRLRQSVTTTFRVRNVETGRVSYVMEHRHPLHSRSGLLLGYEGVWLDVTRQTLAEKLLTSAAWKETLAVLTMGLAHDFSNVMAGIHSLSESFLSQLEETHPFREGMGLIKKSAMQASQLVHRIVHLHLDKPGDRNYHDLNQIVSELLELVRKVIPRRIEIATELSKEPLPVYVDAVEFRQVIINLALNASDAMPERGRLVLRTLRYAERPTTGQLHGAPLRFPCVGLTVQDNGVGIRQEHLDLIFDPFFTTKSGGKGSGLGLYNARLFAEKHQGAIGVDSREAGGASFHVCLPEADFTETSGSTEEGKRPTRGRRGILMYGAANTLLNSTAEWLRTEGYHVATADTLERGVEVLRGGDYNYDLIFLLLDSPGTVLASHLGAWMEALPRLKLVIRPVGRDRDEVDPELLRRAHWVVTPELSQRGVLEKLKEILQD
ncbi:MAG: PAS domain-containing protein [Verrucomicrobiales bacterium]|nr:PAS domain-containing protein [Verrucomicrobiales bacterium]